jgi:hypothetical protein
MAVGNFLTGAMRRRGHWTRGTFKRSVRSIREGYSITCTDPSDVPLHTEFVKPAS